MNCETTRELLSAYVDDEIDVVRSVEIERHIASCDACARSLANQETLSAMIATSAPRHTAPEALRARIRSELRRAAGQSATEASRHLFTLPRVASLAAALALLVGGGALLLHWAEPLRSRDDALLAEAVSSHLRSLMGEHLTDIASSDRHTVAPWFQGKLDFSPTVRDFKSDGFPLVGGRLDYLGDRPAASLVYRRGAHLINVFVRPTDDPDSDAKSTSRRGYNIVAWTRGGMSYWAVSNVAPNDLRQLATLVQSVKTDAPTTEPATTK